MKETAFIKYFIDLFFRIAEKAKKITFPGFDGVPLYDVTVFFFKGIIEGSLTTRASSIAFNFYLAIFPSIIFIFTLIPYIPIDNFQVELLSLMQSVMPNNAYLAFKETLEDIITIQHGSLLSIGFFTAIVFSTNGFNSMIEAFNATKHTIDTRSWLAQRGVALVLSFIVFSLTIVAVSLIVFSQWTMDFLVSNHIIKEAFTLFLLGLGKWIIIIALFFFTISFLFYPAPAKKVRWRFISAGSTLATILTIAISLGFSFYINHFGRYNTLYGSIGAILVILVWLYLNSITLLIGYELNASIKDAHLEKDWD